MDTVTIKIDKEVKKAAQKQARREGISLANLFASKLTSFFTYAIKPREDHKPEEKLNAKTVRELLKISKDIKKGKNLSPVFHNVEDAINYLKHAK
jgi:antitoxin component of RelBE/YafQ-DinJ toxin-antitoxin module